MATSRGTGAAKGAVLRCLESKKNLAGSACALAGVGLTLAGAAGPWWPAVVAGLYGAGALLAPPEAPEPPPPGGPTDRLDEVRERFVRLKEYLAEVELPAAAGGRLAELLEVYGALLAPGWVADALAGEAESVHAVARAVAVDVPECVDAYVRTRWWARITPGGESPEGHLERQLALLREEAERVAADLRETEARRQQTHTTYLEERGRS
ncbi:hypothetical protein AB0953_08350 [Streptomyces sp. NPDC046866]|uniref:hypothetical protein n=1 Tax=Streptomyces sp. NPDC046866 TaxID=3154921 RepID=UPI0034550710